MRVRSARCTSSCVGTPQKKGEYAADLTYVDAAFAALVQHLQPGMVVVGKSTVPAGTAARLLPSIEATGATLVWNPEFLREGFAVEDTLAPDRIVLGINSSIGEKVMREVYHDILATGVPVVVTDFATAELVKVPRLVPGHQDLVHQRDGRGVRGHRRRRDPVDRGALAR